MSLALPKLKEDQIPKTDFPNNLEDENDDE